MPFSDEELIAYLLGDADQALSERIQQALSVQPELLERLTEFRLILGQIDSLAGSFEPPADLVANTLARIDELSVVPLSQEPLPTPGMATGGEGAESYPVLLSAARDVNSRRSAAWDSTALTISLTILCCLALPALVRIRFESRKAQCARNLTITGSELMQYAMNDPHQRFPRVAVEGPASFAGVYAVYLHDMDSSLSPAQLRCASLIGTAQSPLESTAVLQFSGVIPSFSQLQQMALEELWQWQRSIGGDYAYNLGVSEQGSVQAPKCEGRSHFAILADAPVMDAASVPAAGAPVGDSEQYVAHEGRGINIFYEDGRVVFVTTASLFQPNLTQLSTQPDLPAQAMADTDRSLPAAWSDHPFRNQRGQHAIGLHPHDASLAPSHFTPLGGE